MKTTYSILLLSILASLSSGADTNNDDGRTPLHIAAFRGDTETVKRLIAEGADINAKAEGGYTPLHAAAGMGHTEVIRVLIDAGADPESRSDDGLTPLDAAIATGFGGRVKESFRALPQKRANPVKPKRLEIVSTKLKRLKREHGFDHWSWRVGVRNNTSKVLDVSVWIEWLDKDGFRVNNTVGSRKIGPGTHYISWVDMMSVQDAAKAKTYRVYDLDGYEE